jgi:uncharacterized membrane protein
MPWYVKLVVGVGAWITAVVAMLLGGAIVLLLLKIESALALAVIGAAYLALGLWLLRQSDAGLFATQMGIATAAAGAALVSAGFAGEAEEVWVALPVAAVVAVVIFLLTTNKTLQFLTAALVAAVFVITLEAERVPYALDIVSVATPVGLYLLLNPPQRDLAPAAVVLLLTFPLFSVFIAPDTIWARDIEIGGWVARAVHIALFVWLVDGYRRQRGWAVDQRVAIFTAAAVLVCLLLPPGGSAALLLMTLAYVTGSMAFATLGIVLQAQFIMRYYYSLEMTLLDKSLLLMAVGVVLLLAWWFVQRSERRGSRA